MKNSCMLWILLIVPLLMMTFFFGNGVSVSQIETLTLLQLKNGLIFDSSWSVKLVQWDPNTDCCFWPGVQCNLAGHVIELNLENEYISGGIDDSSSLFSLQFLQKLNLAFNHLDNTRIPSKFKELPNLSYLNLSCAGFSGQIPIEIASLTMLETLDLSNYYFDALLKLGKPNLKRLIQNLTKLTDLYLDYTLISEQGEEWCEALSSSLPKLRVLSLSSCNLSGPIHPSLLNLQSLSVINLANNNLSSPVPNFVASFSNLTSLILNYCGLRGTFPKNIFQVHTLQTLDLSDNDQLHGHLPEFKNGTLQKMVLSETSFSGGIPISTGNLKMLSYINLRGCNFNDIVPNSVANLTELVYIDLSNNRFIGPIPSLSSMSKLTDLYLASNMFDGSITSTDWKVLLNLKFLDLHNNSLNGDIPQSLFSIPSLQSLKLSNNHFNGQISAYKNISSLRLDTLKLDGNMLQGPFPRFILILKNLIELTLASNNFSGSLLLNEILALRNLSTLDLSHNNWAIEEIANDSTSASYPQLHSLQLASCNLMAFPAFLTDQSTLSYLDLSENQIRGDIPNWIWNMKLFSLNLSHNFLVNTGFPPISARICIIDLHANQLQGKFSLPPHSIMYLDLSSNNFSSIIPATIGYYITNIHFFSLSSNNIHGSIPNSICNASILEVLDLSNNFLTGTIPKCLVETTSVLGVLNLRRNKLNGTISGKFPGDCRLQTLDLGENFLEGKVPKSLVNCQKLEALNLKGNLLHDVFPLHLNGISKLKVLVLRSNMFYGPIDCTNNMSWPLLQMVDIASNNFSGELPESCLRTWTAMMDNKKEDHGHLLFEFNGWYYSDTLTFISKGMEMELVKVLTVFTSIDFSCNNFQGLIPQVVGQLQALYILNLSHNALTGHIPSSFGNLEDIESLDVSHNSLSGIIPSELASLNFLSYAKFSYNQLVGKIPTSTQLQSFSNASFEGNLGVCGLPLADNCSTIDRAPETRPIASDGSSSIDIEWSWISIELGFIFGLGVVVLPLFIMRKWRICYYRYIDRLFCGFLPLVDLRSSKKKRN